MPRKHRYLTGSEIDILLNYIPRNDPLGLSIALGLFAGLRIGEISKINRSDIKRALLSGMFHVRKEIAKYNKPRTVPVCPLLSKYLKSWYIKHDSYNVKHIVLWHCSMRTVQRRFSEFSKRINIKFTPHDLRHTFACALYNQCKDLSLVQVALGHSSLKTTLIYVHIDGIIQREIEKAYKSFIDLPERQHYNVK